MKSRLASILCISIVSILNLFNMMFTIDLSLKKNLLIISIMSLLYFSNNLVFIKPYSKKDE